MNKVLIIYIPYLGNPWNSHSQSLSNLKQKLQIHILWVFSSYFWTFIVVSKFLSSTLSHSLIRDVYFQLQTRLVEFKGGFSRYFCTKLQRPASLPRLFFANHSLFQLLSPRFLISFPLSFFLTICLSFFSASASVCGPAMLPRCQYCHSRDHLLLRPLLDLVRSRSVKVAIGIPPFINFSNRFEEKRWGDVLTHINSFLHHTLFYIKKFFSRKRSVIFIRFVSEKFGSIERQNLEFKSRLQFKINFCIQKMK